MPDIRINVDTLTASPIEEVVITTANIVDGTIVNADINPSAAIAWSKINTAGTIVNADINNSASIAWSKINNTGAIVNANISGSAAIDSTKISGTAVTLAGIETLTNKRLNSPKINEDVALTATATQLNRVDATSSIQTQLETKSPIASPIFTGTVTIPAGASISGFASTTSPTFTTSIDASATFSAFASATSLTIGGTTSASTTSIQSGINASGVTKEINIGTNGASGSTTNITLGSATSGSLGTLTINENVVYSGLMSTASAAPTIASATTIAPTTPIVFISGTTAIATITAPSPISLNGGQITLVPLGIFTTTTAGNIGLASTAVVRRALIMTYDATTTKWYPSY
jgi:hypothetical protein